MFGCGVELDPETVPETRAVRAGSMLSRNRDNIPDTGIRVPDAAWPCAYTAVGIRVTDLMVDGRVQTLGVEGTKM